MTTETPSLTPDQFTAERQSAVARLQKRYAQIFEDLSTHRHRKAVIVNGKRFDSARDASCELGIPEQAIHTTCRTGRRGTYLKFSGATKTLCEFEARWAK